DMGFGEMAENIPSIGRVALQKGNIAFAVGLLENAFHETCRIVVLKNEEIEAEEPGLLEEAKSLQPRIYFQKIDVLIIDQIGKNIAGTGFDTNVVGRFHTPYAYAEDSPEVTRMAILDLTEQSHGNANGVGIADFTTRRLYDKLIFEQTYPNSLTSTVPISVKIPMVLDNDRQVIQAGIKTCNRLDKHNVRLVRIKDTISLGEIEVSQSLAGEVGRSESMELVGSPYELDFDESGNLF
ncbi:unnamed protein product, partial [marine sediment metagenome]